MRGNDKVIAELNDALTGELKAIIQYMVHGEMCHNWGYDGLGGYFKKQAIEEMRHAEGIIQRILFLDGTPRVDLMPTPKIGANVKAQLENDLVSELETVSQYNSSVVICTEAEDVASRALFERMVRDEETHTEYLEAQIFMIGELGLDNYLAQQLH